MKTFQKNLKKTFGRADRVGGGVLVGGGGFGGGGFGGGGLVGIGVVVDRVIGAKIDPK